MQTSIVGQEDCMSLGGEDLDDLVGNGTILVGNDDVTPLEAGAA